MHGTEHRVSERRALRLSAPRQPVYPASASTPSNAPQPLVSLKRDRSLVTAFPSPAMASACAASFPGSKVLTCYFAHLPAGLPTRSAFRLRRQPLVCPNVRLHPRLKPVAISTGLLCWLCRLPPLPVRSFRSLRINAPAGFATVRSAFRNCPIFVRSPQPFVLQIRLRIIVPDPLHSRRLAVPPAQAPREFRSRWRARPQYEARARIVTSPSSSSSSSASPWLISFSSGSYGRVEFKLCGRCLGYPGPSPDHDAVLPLPHP